MAGENNVQVLIKALIDATSEQNIKNQISTLVTQLEKNPIKLKIDMGNTAQQLSDLQKTINNINASLSNAGKGTSGFSNIAQSVNQANQAVNNTNKALRDQAMLEQQIKNMVDARNRQYQNLIDIKKNTKFIDNADLENIKRLKSELDALAQSGTKDFNAIKLKSMELANAMNNVSSNIRVQRQNMSGLSQLFSELGHNLEKIASWTLGGTAFFQFINAVKESISYVVQMDTALTDLSKVVNFSSTQLNEMKNTAISLGSALGKSSVEIMQGFAETGRYLKNQKDIIEFTKTAIMASNVTDLSVADASKALTTAMISFKMEAKDVPAILDQWNEIQNNFRTSGHDLADSISTVGAAARQAKVSMQELEGMTTGIVSSTGISGSEAGTAIKSMISRTYRLKDDEGQAQDAGKAEAALNKLGIAVKGANGSLNGFYDIMVKLKPKWAEMNDQQKQNTAFAIAGMHHYSKFMGLMDSFDITTKAVSTALHSQNSAFDENQKYLSSITGRWEIFKSKLEGVVNNAISSNFVKGIVSGLSYLADNLEIVAAGLALLGIRFMVGRTSVQAFTKSLTISNITGFVGGLRNVSLSANGAATKLLDLGSSILGVNKATIVSEALQGRSATALKYKALAAKTLTADEILLGRTEKENIITTRAQEIAMKDAAMSARVFGVAIKSALVSTGIGIALIAITEGIMHIVSAFQEASEAEEKFNAKVQSNMKKYSSNVSDIKKTVDAYEELNNKKEAGIQLTKEEANKYTELSNKLADVLGINVVQSITDEGNARLKNIDIINKEIEAYKLRHQAQLENEAVKADKSIKKEKSQNTDTQSKVEDIQKIIEVKQGKETVKAFNDADFAMHNMSKSLAELQAMVKTYSAMIDENNLKMTQNAQKILTSKEAYQSLSKSEQELIASMLVGNSKLQSNSAIDGFLTKIKSLKTESTLTKSQLDKLFGGNIPTTALSGIDELGKKYQEAYSKLRNSNNPDDAMANFESAKKAWENYKQFIETVLKQILQSMNIKTKDINKIISKMIPDKPEIIDFKVKIDDIQLKNFSDKAVKQVTASVQLLDNALQQLSNKGSITSSTMKKLIQAFPELATEVKNNNGVLTVSKELLEEIKNKQKDTFDSAILGEGQTLNATITAIENKIQGYKVDYEKLKAYEEQKRKEIQATIDLMNAQKGASVLIASGKIEDQKKKYEDKTGVTFDANGNPQIIDKAKSFQFIGSTTLDERNKYVAGMKDFYKNIYYPNQQVKAGNNEINNKIEPKLTDLTKSIDLGTEALEKLRGLNSQKGALFNTQTSGSGSSSSSNNTTENNPLAYDYVSEDKNSPTYNIDQSINKEGEKSDKELQKGAFENAANTNRYIAKLYGVDRVEALNKAARAASISVGRYAGLMSGTLKESDKTIVNQLKAGTLDDVVNKKIKELTDRYNQLGKTPKGKNSAEAIKVKNQLDNLKKYYEDIKDQYANQVDYTNQSTDSKQKAIEFQEKADQIISDALTKKSDDILNNFKNQTLKVDTGKKDKKGKAIYEYKTAEDLDLDLQSKEITDYKGRNIVIEQENKLIDQKIKNSTSVIANLQKELALTNNIKDAEKRREAQEAIKAKINEAKKEVIDLKNQKNDNYKTELGNIMNGFPKIDELKTAIEEKKGEYQSAIESGNYDLAEKIMKSIIGDDKALEAQYKSLIAKLKEVAKKATPELKKLINDALPSLENSMNEVGKDTSKSQTQVIDDMVAGERKKYNLDDIEEHIKRYEGLLETAKQNKNWSQMQGYASQLQLWNKKMADSVGKVIAETKAKLNNQNLTKEQREEYEKELIKLEDDQAQYLSAERKWYNDRMETGKEFQAEFISMQEAQHKSLKDTMADLEAYNAYIQSLDTSAFSYMEQYKNIYSLMRANRADAEKYKSDMQAEQAKINKLDKDHNGIADSGHEVDQEGLDELLSAYDTNQKNYLSALQKANEDQKTARELFKSESEQYIKGWDDILDAKQNLLDDVKAEDSEKLSELTEGTAEYQKEKLDGLERELAATKTINNQIRAEIEALEALKKTYFKEDGITLINPDAKDTVDDITKKINSLHKNLLQVQTDGNNIAKSIKDTYEENIKSMTDLETKIKNALKERYEYEIKMLEEKQKKQDEAYDKTLKQIEDLYNLQNYNDDLSKKQDEAQETRSLLDSMALADDPAAMTRKLELQKQLADQEYEINKMQRQHDYEQQKDDLESKKKAYDDDIEAQKEAIKEKEDDVKLTAEAKKKIEIAFAKATTEEEKKIQKEAMDDICDLLEKYDPDFQSIGFSLGDGIGSNVHDGIQKYISQIGTDFNTMLQQMGSNIPTVTDAMNDAIYTGTRLSDLVKSILDQQQYIDSMGNTINTSGDVATTPTGNGVNGIHDSDWYNQTNIDSTIDNAGSDVDNSSNMLTEPSEISGNRDTAWQQYLYNKIRWTETTDQAEKDRLHRENDAIRSMYGFDPNITVEQAKQLLGHLQGYEDGGVVEGKQLAWLSENNKKEIVLNNTNTEALLNKFPQILDNIANFTQGVALSSGQLGYNIQTANVPRIENVNSKQELNVTVQMNNPVVSSPQAVQQTGNQLQKLLEDNMRKFQRK